jgi:ABC-type multidrug transport system ATPase subunit
VEPVVSVRGLRKSCGQVVAVAGIELEIERGEIFAFLGPNGAAKTTTVESPRGLPHPHGRRGERARSRSRKRRRGTLWAAIGVEVAARRFSWLPKTASD